MNIADLQKWLAGHRPPPAKCCAVLQGGREQRLAMGVNSQRWHRIANALASMNAEGVALYNAADELLDRTEIEYDGKSGGADTTSTPAPRAPVDISILKDASDVNSLVHALAQAFATVVTNVSASQAEAHKMAFHELREVNKIQADLIKSLRVQAEEALDAREDALEEREAALVEQKNGDATMNKLLELAGPEIAKKLFSGPAAPSAPGGTNGTPPAK